ncbi:uncharacterized protein B0P05DRAFT_635838 [Gilbertella persicaria]|uniref:uncharacterized protein n=1 Tax=Gilbertella persicaria TaxID=101096 RepID=UPI00221E6D0E|nr:uncharacterized protein B0P05DRAFT_635838 [Gilbertella persicaria]KAI8085886.1 hypothetical protein B0P05DRAFT_635838 [Gilbertella persicaria]
MENNKVFQDRNVIGICEYITSYCELYINATNKISSYSARPLYTFLPTLLVYIFGAPNTRGWIQTDIPAPQEQAIKSLLSVNGSFIQALKKLSFHSEYSYDLVTDSLPADVKKVLSAGAIQLLPRVYSNCSYVNIASQSNTIDLRAAATRQSTLLPSNAGGERVIRLNMIQLYLFYFLHVPTWPPLAQPTLPQPPTPSNPGLHATPRIPSLYNNTNTTVSTTTSTSIQYQILGNVRSITLSVYGAIFEEYAAYFMPLTSNATFPKFVNTFFLDACVELWIRTPWVAPNQKLSTEFMQFITAFVKYITRHDLRQCMHGSNPVLTEVYQTVKNELYMLISRLALNWSHHDDYIAVVELWAIWSAPWKLGEQPTSAEKVHYAPIAQGWVPWMLENLPFYVLLVDIFLQRTSTFMYKDAMPQPSTSMISTTTSYGDQTTIRGNLRILYRIINVLKAENLVDFLACAEQGLKAIRPGVALSVAVNSISDPFKYISNLCYGTEQMDFLVLDKFKIAFHLLGQIEGEVWRPRGLYSNDIEPRSEALLKTLSMLHNAIMARMDSNSNKASSQLVQLREAYELIHTIFKVTDMDGIFTDVSGSSKTQATQKPPLEMYKPKLAQGSKEGFLTPEEKKAVIEGKMFCSYDNIHAMGIRAKTFVRSYEFKWMVQWTLENDPKLNCYYNYYCPENWRPKFFPKELTFRPWARRSTLIYTVLLTLLLIYTFFKMICKLLF